MLDAEHSEHPILRGVASAHVLSGGYVGHPVKGSTILARGQILDGMQPDSPVANNEKQKVRHSVAWTRIYQQGNPKSRVFATTHGASVDILNKGYRRLLINAHFWCLGMEDLIDPDATIDFVGPYNPVTFNFGGYRRGAKPADIAGYETPIYDDKLPTIETNEGQ